MVPAITVTAATPTVVGVPLAMITLETIPIMMMAVSAIAVG